MGQPLNILHLEDNPRDTDLMTATLRAQGIECEVLRVDTRDAFLSELHNRRYDIVISDVSLPGFDGISAQKIWQDQRPTIPFIFLSGTFGEEVAIERLKEGATDYVLKNWIDKLPSVVRRALREMQERADRERAQHELHTLNEQLEARVQERTAQLSAAHEAMDAARHEAERANRAKSEFLSRMSHDLRTPLNAVLGFAQLLEMDSLSTDQRESVAQILEAGRHLLDLMNEVLDISRIESGNLSLSPEPVAVAEVVDQVVRLTRPLGAARQIEVRSLARECPTEYVRADRQRLNQILLNLVSNAIKYNRPNGTVTVSCDARPDGRLRINVTDTGAGILPEKLDLLFRPFERLGADQRGIEGTGLGLALSRGLAEAMGGELGVESEVDRGSTFWLELGTTCPDLSDAPRIGADAAAVPEFDDAVTGTILYIDDNASNVRLVERLLNKRRPRVSLLNANTGGAGIEMAVACAPDMIFLDLHLPDTPGEEVLRRLWEDPRTRRIPVAVLSADATLGQSRRLIAAGARAYLTKPLDVAMMFGLVDKGLAL